MSKNFMNKKWQIVRGLSKETKDQFSETNPVVLQLLFNRGLKTQDKIDEFLRSNWSNDIHDPFLFQNMNKAVDRIFKALERKEKVLIYGDYDADGICGTAILYATLQRISFDKIDIYIPHRESEGYGLNLKAVDKIKKTGIDLIITVDLGVSNVEQVKKVRELGMDIIITDHHELKLNNKEEVILPPANAIIHARIPGDKYPFKDLSGTGTAFKLAQALLDQTLEENEAFEKWLLDLTAIGTVADIVPLLGENRTLVKYGLMVLNKTQRIGLRELIKTAKLKNNNHGEFNNFNLNSWNIAWQLAPRINAAGRITHAQEALELILTESQTEAEALASHLNKINNERQKIADKIYEEALGQIFNTENVMVGPSVNSGQALSNHDISTIRQAQSDIKNKYLLHAYNSNWPIGVIGLVAGKLADKFYRPVILMTEVDGIIKGSGRSIPEFHLVKGLSKVKDLLLNFGGHAGAAGFSLKKEKQDDFIKSFTQVVKDELKDTDLRSSLNIDMEVDFARVNQDLVEAIENFQPFGKDNPQPLFLSKKLTVKNLETVGAQNQHLKLMVCSSSPVFPSERSEPRDLNNQVCKIIGFNLAEPWARQLKINDKIDIVFELGFNEWNGNRELQIKLKDLRKSYQ